MLMADQATAVETPTKNTVENTALRIVDSESQKESSNERIKYILVRSCLNIVSSGCRLSWLKN